MSLSHVEQKMMLFTPIQAICALYEDPALFGEPLGLPSALQLQRACPNPVPTDPCAHGPQFLLLLRSIFLSLSLPPPPHLCLPPPSCLCHLHSHFPCPLLSVAKALCVKTVGAQALKLFQEHPIFSEVISDEEAVAAIEKFVGMFRVLQRPAYWFRSNWSPRPLVCQGIPSPQSSSPFCPPPLPVTSR